MLSPFSSPKRSRKESKNPYSNRGLDKFSALLSELDEKRQSIYANRLDSDGPPLVRFVFKSSGECVPVMIKTKKVTKKKVDGQEDDLKIKTESKTKEAKEIKETESETTEKKQRCVLNENLEKISRPNRFLPVTVMLVLVFLVFFGRTVSIMCTCIVWYLVPMIKEQSRKKGSTYKTKKKKKKMNERMAHDQNVLKEKLPHLSAAPGKTR
uniref:ZCF37 n=1 Tax=Brassica oleracea var. oleracea TaxID=109376 RepID=A0A0D3C8Z7_BRAOL